MIGFNPEKFEKVVMHGYLEGWGPKKTSIHCNEIGLTTKKGHDITPANVSVKLTALKKKGAIVDRNASKNLFEEQEEFFEESITIYPLEHEILTCELLDDSQKIAMLKGFYGLA